MLPPAMQEVILSQITAMTDRDWLHEMIVCCYEVLNERQTFSKARVVKKIEEIKKQRNHENNTLYNPFRNISMNQCIGKSDTPVSEWMNFSDWREWD